MPDITEVKIAKALLARAASFTATPALPVAEPNIDFKPPKNGKYLRVTHIPNVTQRLFIGSNDPHRYLGILQISVHWPKNRGEIEPREIAGAVIAHFPCDLELDQDGIRVRVSKRPQASDIMIEDAGIMIAVSIEYEAFA